MTSQMPGNGTLPGTGWTVDGNYDLLSRIRRRTLNHPRLLFLCFGRAVKPYRLPLPALAPALNAGVRLARDPRASVRESLRTEALRDNVPVRPEDPGFPVTTAPLPFRFAHVPTGDFPLRVPFDEWPLELVERPAAGRVSEVRRGVRALVGDCAGLRLRACWAGRLKCVRAVAGLPLAAALWPFELPFPAELALTDGVSAEANWLGGGVCTTGSGSAGSEYESS